jgi:hypothetical protein
MAALLEINNLSICFDGVIKAVDGLSLAIEKGQTLALVVKAAPENPYQRCPFCVFWMNVTPAIPSAAFSSRVRTC